MQCELCGGLVTWRGPLSALTHTECENCGGQNCQVAEPVGDDTDELRPETFVGHSVERGGWCVMSRSGYSYECDCWAMIRWRGAVKQAVNGARGQAMLRELVQALDALPEKRLATGSLVTAEGDYCTLGALGRARGMDMEPIDPEDREAVAKAFGVAEALAAEIMYLNDKEGPHEQVYFNFVVCGPMRTWERHTQLRWKQNPQAGAARWSQMRAWALANLKAPNTTAETRQTAQKGNP
jgi:hypothetical protein